MPVIFDPMRVPGRRSTIYPEDLAAGFELRVKRALTSRLGLTQFGINLTTLEPGAKSAHRHWHAQEDEALYILQGAPTLVTMDGETQLGPAMAVGFPAGDKNGHHLVNRTDTDVIYLEIGSRLPADEVTYPDVDLHAVKRKGKYKFTRKDGTPYP